jgi:flagellar biosynthesis protein FliQ
MKNIKRDAIKEDLLFFALPAIITLFVGLVVSMLYAADSIVIKILALVD